MEKLVDVNLKLIMSLFDLPLVLSVNLNHFANIHDMGLSEHFAVMSLVNFLKKGLLALIFLFPLNELY